MFNYLKDAVFKCNQALISLQLCAAQTEQGLRRVVRSDFLLLLSLQEMTGDEEL